MSYKKRNLTTTFLLVLCFSGAANADLIDFENADSWGGDNAAISDSYFQDYGVSFTMYTGKTASSAYKQAPRFEQVGISDGGDAFNYRDPSSGNIVYGPGLEEGLGDYYLAISDNFSQLYNTGYVRLTIDYNEAVSGASGQLWDLDENRYGTEQFQITAYNAQGDEVATLTSPDVSYEDNLDGLAWTWSVAGDDITQIDMEWIGTRTNYVGLAFDNFNATEANGNADSVAHAAPVPAAVQIGLVGLLGLAIRRRDVTGGTPSE